jgi:mannose-6-phosphate isomerase
MEPDLYPLRFRPVYKNYFWGGDRIVRVFGRGAPPGVYAESWEIADRPDGMSVAINGPLAGRTLRELTETYGQDLTGTRAAGASFPLLVKLIDARERLSVQVHPDEEDTRKHGGEPKTEVWYVLEVAPGAGVFAGLKPGTTEQKVRERLASGTLPDQLRFMPVERGEAVFVPGGRIHSIGAGCLLLEVQQNSNTTYRLYDWDRRGPDGQPRPLHVESALRAARWDDRDVVKPTPRLLDRAGKDERWEVFESRYFRLERLLLESPYARRADRGSFRAIFVVSGSAEIVHAAGTESLAAGVTCLLPAVLNDACLVPAGGRCELLEITLP